MIFCFSDLSQTHVREPRGVVIKIKGKTGKKVHENGIFVKIISFFETLFFLS